MKEYLFEMHAHTSEVSACANEDSYSLLNLYTKLKYDGVVLTNHMNSRTFSAVGMEDEPWDKKAEYFLSGYKKLKDAAEGKLTVLLGMEICFYSCPNDYLVYGINKEFLYNTPKLLEMNIKSFYELAHKNGFLVFQAHPFRIGMKVTNPQFLDGIEIFNGNPRHNSSNDIAEAWAKKYDLMVSSGSDYHELEDLASGGIYFNKEITDEKMLVEEMLKRDYKIKRA